MSLQDHQAGDPRARLLATLPVTDRRLDLAGGSTAVLTGGEGPPIVLQHGPGESAVWWLRVAPTLVSTHRVVVPGLPGHGASEAPADGLDASAVLRWLDDLIEHTGTNPPTVVGHLLGGAIAARFAADRRDRLTRLVLVDSLGLGRFRPAARFAFGMLRFLVRPTDRAYHRFLDQWLYDRDDLIASMGSVWEPFVAYTLDRSRTPSVRAAMRTLMEEVGVPRIPAADLERIDVLTALIWGRDDRAIRLGIAEDASARYGWPLRVIENAGDDPKLERPEAFLNALYGAIDDRPLPSESEATG